MRRATIALLAVLVAALAVAGCGDGKSTEVPTTAEYKQQFTPISAEIAQLGRDVGKAVTGATGKSNKALEKTFGDLAGRVNDVAKRLDGTTPPADPSIQKNHALLVTGLNTSADDLEAISRAAGKKDLKAAGLAAAKLTRDSTSVGKPRFALDKELGIKP